MNIRLLKKASLLIAILLLLVSMVPVYAANDDAETIKTSASGGTTYYISQSEGDDSNDGLSEETPWKSFKNLPDLKLKGGDKLLLKCGDRWVGEYFRLNSPTGTSEDNMVLLSSYGKGEKPKIALFEDKVEKYAGTPLMEVVNAEYFEVKGLDIGHCGVGLNFYYDGEVEKKCVKVSECHFHDMYGFFQVDRAGITKFPHTTALAVNGRAKKPGESRPFLIGFYIDRCTTYDVGALYTYSSSENTSAHVIHGMYVTNCDMRNNSLYGIALCSVRYGYMDNCRILDCGSRPAPHGSMGIMHTAKDFTVMNCEIGYQQRQDENPDGGGIDFEWCCYDSEYINNYIHDNSGVGVMFYASGQPSSANPENRRIRFLYNVFENNNQNVKQPGGAELVAVPAYALADSIIYNNMYMESRNMFTMYMQPGVKVEGNQSYPVEERGKVWPLLDFDVVRDYVINGTPIPAEELLTETATLSFWEANASYLFGGLGALVLVIIAGIIVSAILRARKGKKNEVL